MRPQDIHVDAVGPAGQEGGAPVAVGDCVADGGEDEGSGGDGFEVSAGVLEDDGVG